MSKSGNFFLSYEDFTAYGALCAFGETCVSAIRCNCRDCFFLVSKGGSLVACIAGAASRAGIGGVALVVTSRSGYFFIVTMTCRRKLFIRCVITSGAGFVCIPTDSGTSGSLCLVGDLIVSESVNSLCVGIAAYRTGEGLETCLLAGCFLGDGFLIGVRNCIYGMCGTAELFAAYGTVNYFIVAACAAAGCRCRILNYGGACLVAKCVSFNCFSVKLLAAYRATENGIVRATLCASRSNYVFLNPFVGCLVAELCICNRLTAHFLAAYGTVNYFVVRSLFCAGGGNLIFNNSFACLVAKRIY